jgi:DNA-binding GntR family transcriptional regulator
VPPLHNPRPPFGSPDRPALGDVMAQPGPLNLLSLREQVYRHLRDAIIRGELAPGSFLDQNRISTALGISRTPLRDALLQLETEGFVTILPRRGVQVRSLTLDDVRHLYEVIGALEGSALLAAAPTLTPADLARMRTLNADMVVALGDDDFDTYYALNLAFHNVFLERSDNARLVRTVRVCKERLYDFARPPDFVPDWELASTGEHAELVDFLEHGDWRGGADYLRDVHWGFAVQQPYVERYYFGAAPPNAAE